MKGSRIPTFVLALGLALSAAPAGGAGSEAMAGPEAQTDSPDHASVFGIWRLSKFDDRAVEDAVCLYLSSSTWFVVVEERASEKLIFVGGNLTVKDAELRFFSLDYEAKHTPFLWLPKTLTDSAKNKAANAFLPEWDWLDAFPRFELKGGAALIMSGGRAGDKTLVFERLAAATSNTLAGVWAPPKSKVPAAFEVPPATWTFGPDGSFSSKKKTFGREVETTGAYQIFGPLLQVTMKGQAEENLYPFAHYTLFDKSASILMAKEPTGKLWAFYRSGAAGGSGGGTAKPSLGGTWSIEDESGEARVTFATDGSYTRETRRLGEIADKSAGKWRVEGATLVIEDQTEGTSRMPFRLTDPNRLELTIEGSSVVFKRWTAGAGGAGGGAAGGTGGGAAPGGGTTGGETTGGTAGDTGKTDAAKAALQATWYGPLVNVYGIPSGVLTLTFLADGRFEGVWALGAGAAFPQAGRWKLAGAQIILEHEGGGANTLKYTLVGNALTLDSFPSMRPATLYRQ